MGPLVIYHGGGCADGFCAAWLFRAAFPTAELYPALHGTPPPDVAGREVYLVDFSYKRPTMLAMDAAARSLTVLDHHATAAAELVGFAGELHRAYGCVSEVVIDQTKSGGRLAWEYLFRRDAFRLTHFHDAYRIDKAPWLVDYTEDRDLWRWALPHSREVNAALRSHPLDFEVWDGLEANVDRHRAASWNLFVGEGRGLLREQARVVESHVRHAREVRIGGHTVPCVNATVLMSEIGEALSAGRPFAATYFDRADGLRVYSLRSREGGVDVAEVARGYGGGGHVRAAGFQLPEGVPL